LVDQFVVFFNSNNIKLAKKKERSLCDGIRLNRS